MSLFQQSSSGTIPGPPVSQLVLAQLLALLGLCLVVAAVDRSWVTGLLAGGGIEIAGRAYFSYYAFRHAGARQMAQVVRSFRRGELGKFVLVTALLGAAFAAHRALDPVMVLAGYMWSWLAGTLGAARLVSAGRLW